MAFENSGGSFRQSEQTCAWPEEKGVAHILQEGPSYRLIPAQQSLQKGAKDILSVGDPQEGHSEGKM